MDQTGQPVNRARVAQGPVVDDRQLADRAKVGRHGDRDVEDHLHRAAVGPDPRPATLGPLQVGSRQPHGGVTSGRQFTPGVLSPVYHE